MENQGVNNRGKKTFSADEKLRAIMRVKAGERKASVSRDIGAPESTLRGWCKSEFKIYNQVLQGLGIPISSTNLSGSSSSLQPPTSNAVYWLDPILLAQYLTAAAYHHQYLQMHNQHSAAATVLPAPMSSGSGTSQDNTYSNSPMAIDYSVNNQISDQQPLDLSTRPPKKPE